MEQQKGYQVEFYIGLLDYDTLLCYPLEKAIDKVSELIGNCTIIPCIGSYNHHGIRVNMNSLKVIKFINYEPAAFISDTTNEFKEIFNQESIISKISACNIQLN